MTEVTNTAQGTQFNYGDLEAALLDTDGSCNICGSLGTAFIDQALYGESGEGGHTEVDWHVAFMRLKQAEIALKEMLENIRERAGEKITIAATTAISAPLGVDAHGNVIHTNVPIGSRLGGTAQGKSTTTLADLYTQEGNLDQ